MANPVESWNDTIKRRRFKFPKKTHSPRAGERDKSEESRKLADMVERAKFDNSNQYLHFVFNNYQTYGVS
jgi:hypothetical protein